MSLAENIVQVDQLKAELNTFRPLSKDAEEKLWDKLRLEWNYNSNHIEGNTLTYGETMLLLLHDKTTGDHEKREYDEMQAHDIAISLIREWSTDDRQLTEADIKNLNQIILVKPFWKEAITSDGQPTRRLIKVGNYKEYPNHVRLKNGGIFKYASPDETPRLMQELVTWFNSVKDAHPVILAAELHYRYIRIHPFDDGNGRIARLLVNYVLMKYGYTPIIIKSADKENYLTALQKADAGDRGAFYEYIVIQAQWTLEMELKAAKGIGLEDPDDLDKEISLLKRNFQNEVKITEKGTVENICLTIEYDIIPLFKELDKKAQSLKDLFFDFNTAVRYEFLGKSNMLIGEDDRHFEILELLCIRARQDNLQFTKLSYSCELKALKKTVEAQHMWLGLDVDFSSYNYRIKTMNESQPKVYVYGKRLLKEELDLIIRPMVKEIITRIQSVK